MRRSSVSSLLLRSSLWVSLWTSLAALAGACDDLSEFRGTFRGDIVPGNFVRSCFATDATATLRFDPDHAVGDVAGLPEALRNTLTTDDKTFDDTLLEPITALPHDPLSQLDFPGPKRLRNFLLLARPKSGPLMDRDALVVVSLLEKKRVEVRIIARTVETTTACPGEQSDGDGDGGVADASSRAREYFGLFRLRLTSP